MADFRYTALDAHGLERTGVITADHPRDAARLLRARGLYVLTVGDGAERQSHSGQDVLVKLRELLPVRTYDRVFFFQQMALMLRSGLPMLEALDTAQAIARNARLAGAIGRMIRAVRSGERLSEAMAEEEGIFPPIAVQLVKSAEASGEMDLILERIAEDLDRKADLKRNLLTALMYPAIVVVAAVGVSVFLVTGIIPKMAKFLERKGNALPSATRNLLDLSHFMQQWGAVILVAFGVTVAVLAFTYSRPRGRLWLDRVFLALPKIGPSLQTAAVTQLSWSMAVLLKSGVTVLESLRITAQLVPNKAIAAVVEAAQSHILAGRDVAFGLQSPLLPRLVPQMIAIGERTGTLDRIMRELGNYYQRELTLQIKRLTAMIEPALTVLIGGMVGYVYYAFFQALLGVST